jgi:DNA-binding transcriptional ArsR family regulator
MEHPMQPELIGKVVERFKALADENRIRLLLCLRRGECNVMALTRELGLAQASVSKHLGVLKRVGLVEAKRKGTQAIYRVHDASIYELCRHVCDGVLSHLKEEHAALRLGPLEGRSPIGRPTRQRRKGRKS